MNKKDLIAAVAAKANMPQKDVAVAVDALTATITETLANGEAVQLMGFGTFEVKQRAARVGRNPKTGETCEIAASKATAFKAGKLLKDAIQN